MQGTTSSLDAVEGEVHCESVKRARTRLREKEKGVSREKEKSSLARRWQGGFALCRDRKTDRGLVCFVKRRQAENCRRTLGGTQF